jgi:hypothetical protein
MVVMSDLKDFPFDDLPDSGEGGFKPWEQRPVPGMGGGASTPSEQGATQPERLCQEMMPYELPDIIERQTDLAYYPMVERYTTPDTDQEKNPRTNQLLWQLFVGEELYDTRRVTLKEYHLFEWFPLAPGRFHTSEAHGHRQSAYEMMFPSENGRSYFNPHGKSEMLRGGIGAVRLRPRMIAGEAHYFMTASANGVCHEGFPVLMPRRFYGSLKKRLLRDGAVPLTLSGEMRYLLGDDAPTFFGGNREIPQLYLHVDQVEILPQPRPEIDAYSVSVAISFIGEFEEREGIYTTYATFNPAKRDSLQQAVQWLEKFYVTGRHKGVVITDFDEVQPRFPDAVFGLPNLMVGRLSIDKTNTFLKNLGLGENTDRPYFKVYKTINTQGGAYIEGDVHTGGGDFIGRDKVIRGGT